MRTILGNIGEINCDNPCWEHMLSVWPYSEHRQTIHCDKSSLPWDSWVVLDCFPVPYAWYGMVQRGIYSDHADHQRCAQTGYVRIRDVNLQPKIVHGVTIWRYNSYTSELSTHCGRNKMTAIHTDDIFKRIFVNEKYCILIRISLKFVAKGQIYNIPALVQIMTWCRPGAKPSFEAMVAYLPTHIRITWCQWVKG